ncbi:MAG: sigma-70 family RNA polymerase sigma factor [Chloroflexi bacterium]|nr:sigma-70 family RNA polymerase sigma factor [Chloroflexota bacterium]
MPTAATSIVSPTARAAAAATSASRANRAAGIIRGDAEDRRENTAIRPIVHQPATDGGELLRRARAGDGRAFEDLARQAEAGLYRHVLRIVGGEAEAEDVVQDALLSAWRSLASFQGGSFRAWVFRIATNRSIDLIRARRRRGELPLEPPEDDEVEWAEPIAPGPDPVELASQAEALDGEAADPPRADGGAQRAHPAGLAWIWGIREPMGAAARQKRR